MAGNAPSDRFTSRVMFHRCIRSPGTIAASALHPFRRTRLARHFRFVRPDRGQDAKHILTSDPDRLDIFPKALDPHERSMPCSQFFAVLALRHRGRFASNVRSAASRNVGALVRRLSASGSRPSATATRLANARRRASASPMTGNGPSPMSRRLPSMVRRWIQLFDPPRAMFRYSVTSAWYMPGSESAFALAVVSRPIPFPTRFPTFD